MTIAASNPDLTLECPDAIGVLETTAPVVAAARSVRIEPEADARHLHDFQGRRCDDTVAAVLARLRAAGVIRDH